MQKKLIALAVAAISAAPAFAQSNVTIYGRMDYGYMSTSGNSGGVQGAAGRGEFASGIQSGSRLGFRGNEDLGNGMKAIFQMETGIGNDAETSTGGHAAGAAGARTANAGGLFTSLRNAYVGVTGNFGTVVGGRLDGVRYGIFNKYDPFAGGGMGNFTQMTGQVDRADNAVAYISPTFGGGFNVVAAYSSHIGNDAVFGNDTTQEAADNNGDARLYTLNVNYNNGPISIAADVETVKEANGGIAANRGKHKVATLAGSYDFGMVKLSGLWDSHKANDLTTGNWGGTVADNNIAAGAGQSVDYRSYFVGLSAPVMTNGLVKFVWGKVDDKRAANADSKKVGIGFNYSLSKRTGLYADYGKISNNANGVMRIDAGANAGAAPGFTGATVTGSTRGVKGLAVGMAHTF